MDPDRYREPAVAARVEVRIQRSVFIGHVTACHDEAEARSFLGRVQAEHRDATHNCWAWIFGPEPVTEYSSDAGEPSGTAGRPILGALKRSGLVNAMVVVTRYFGGVKLGVRGLIEAYGGVAEKALEAAGAVERLVTRPFTVRLPYASVGAVTRLFEERGAAALRWAWGEDATLTADVPRPAAEGLTRALEELKARGVIRN